MYNGQIVALDMESSPEGFAMKQDVEERVTIFEFWCTCRAAFSMSLDRSSRMRIVSIAAGLLLVLQPAMCSLKDPVAYAQDLRDNREAAIAADSLLGKITPLYTGYASLNSAVPVKVLVNCHYGPVPVNGTASSSASAKQYIDDISYIVGDGYQPVVEKQEKGTYNQSWSLGITWGGM